MERLGEMIMGMIRWSLKVILTVLVILLMGIRVLIFMAGCILKLFLIVLESAFV